LHKIGRGTNQQGKPLPAATYYYILRLDLTEGILWEGRWHWFG